MSQIFWTFSMLLGWVHRYVCHWQKFSCNYFPLCHINGTGLLDYMTSLFLCESFLGLLHAKIVLKEMLHLLFIRRHFHSLTFDRKKLLFYQKIIETVLLWLNHSSKRLCVQRWGSCFIVDYKQRFLFSTVHVNYVVSHVRLQCNPSTAKYALSGDRIFRL